MQCKKGIYFLFDFNWYSIHFDIVVKNRWGGGFYLTDKICLAWQKLFVDSPLWKLCSHKFLSCLLDEYTQTFYSIYRNINSDLKHKGSELH